MAWNPDQGQLRQLVGYLRDSLSGHNQNAQKYATLVCIILPEVILRLNLMYGSRWRLADPKHCAIDAHTS